MRKIHGPVFIASGTEDTLTPPPMARAVFAQVNEPKRLFLVPRAGHDDLLETGGKAFGQ
jgi:pimeloyl-ACP methyl ester carboxylesterase